MKRVFTSTDFAGHWAVGTAAVVLADTPEEARALLTRALEARGLLSGPFTLQEMDRTAPQAIVLRDGNY